MNIAVYCGAASGSRQIYADKTIELGTWMGENGHRLVYGGGNTGLMGTIADSVLQAGGEAIGVLPQVPLIQSRRHPGLTEYVDTATMHARKSVMIERADAFIALPGGTGTLDEITEVLSLASLDLVDGPIVFLDIEGYYEPVKAMLDRILGNGFGRGEFFDRVLFSDDVGEIAAFLTAQR